MLAAVKHQDHDGSRTGLQAAAAASFARKIRAVARGLSRRGGERSRPSCTSSRGLQTGAIIRLYWIGIVASTPGEIIWWYSWDDVLGSRTLKVVVLVVFEGRLDVNLLCTAARAGCETRVNLILEEGADIRESGALEVAAGAGHGAWLRL